MNCLRCGNHAEASDSFCRHCGNALTYLAGPSGNSTAEDEKQGATLLLVYMCWTFFSSLMWLAVNKLMMRGAWDGRIKVFEILGWGTQLVSLALLVIFAAIAKSSRIRIFFIIFAAIELLLIFGYRVMKN